jgi:hypothetical protein
MYKLTNNPSIVILLSESASIPLPAAEAYGFAYQAWLAAGNTPDAVDAPPAPTYQQLRAAAYPPITDYLDAIVKGDKAQIKAYIDACLAVKVEYPKEPK